MIAELFTAAPKGYRDIYWCWIENEPIIITYRDALPFCTGCGCNPLELEGMHTFMAHVLKPRGVP